MAQIIKQIAIKKDTGWEKREIGTDWNKVYLTSPLLGQNSGKTLNEVLNSCFPQDGLESGLLESDNGKIKSSKINSNAITELENRIELLENNNEEKNSTWVNSIIQNYIDNYWTSLITGDKNKEIINSLVEQALFGKGYQPVQVETLANFYAAFSNALYPEGSLFITTKPPEVFNPKTTLGGEWEQTIKDKFLIDTEMITEEGFLSVTPKLTTTIDTKVSIQDHTYTPEGNITNLNFKAAKNEIAGQGVISTLNFRDRMVVTTSSDVNTINATFEGENVQLGHIIQQPSFKTISEPINIIPPYQKVYIWERTKLTGVTEIISFNLTDWEGYLLSPETVNLWKKVDNTATESEV